MAIPNGYRFPDVNHYRTVCVWDAYGKAYPVSACKASEGATGRDPSFQDWRREMRRRLLLPIPYHFLRVESSVAAQISNYLMAADDGHPFGVMLDLETSGKGTNATIDQAHEWFTGVSQRVDVPYGCMLLYMPRWWYAAHGGGSTKLKAAILWNSNYRLTPDISPFAGDVTEIIQYSSTAPVAGMCAPGTGDMNVAIGMSAAQFMARITKGAVSPAPVPPHAPQEDDCEMFLYTSAGKPVFFCDGGKSVGLNGQDDLVSIQAGQVNAGRSKLPVYTFDADTFQQYRNRYPGD